jgi:hypothetical protein
MIQPKFPQTVRPATAAAVVVAVLSCLAVLTACAGTIAPTRTLPGHIKRIYVREFTNLSRNYGLQADLTLFVTDAFIADGRLDVVQSERADARLEGRIKSFRETTNGTSGERFPLFNTMEMVCVVDLWDPYDTDRIAPMARYTVPAAIQYVADARRSVQELQTDARERLQRQMAINIVQTVLTGSPESLKPLEQKAVQKFQQRQSPQQHEPVAGPPRFPRPTPIPR